MQTQGVFHPKLYFFYTDDNDWDCIIGSANWTRGAMSANSELCMHLNANDDQSGRLFEEFMTLCDSFFLQGELLTEKDIEIYRKQYERHRKHISSLSGQVATSANNHAYVPCNAKGYQFAASWEEYYKLIRKTGQHRFRDRLKLIADVKDYFQSASFAEMSIDKRKTIAGLHNQLNPLYGIFGRMKANGKWNKHVTENAECLSNAIDQIPQDGEVTQKAFNQFIKLFTESTGYKKPIGTATRLLAMKRPDIFICVDSANIESLKDTFGIKSIKNFTEYWLFITNYVQNCEWWNSPMRTESKQEKQAWEARVAMLDAIHYLKK